MLDFITNLGDLSILLPLVLAILIWLATIRCPRGAVAWLTAAAFCGGATGLLKIYLYVCPVTPDLVSPSGHTSLSTLVYGGLSVIVASRARGGRRFAAACLGGVIIMMIAASRLLLSAHTVLEVFVGFVVGAIALSIFADSYLRHRPANASLPPLAVAGVLLIILMQGRELHAEELLHAVGGYLRIGSFACGSA